jgi:hypothetical protein
MQGAKPWQIGLIVLAVIAVIASISYNIIFSDAPAESTREFHLVDIETGDLYFVQLADGMAAVLPAPSPKTKNMTIFPLVNENGGWRIDPAFRQLAANVGQTLKSSALDSKDDGAVKLTSDKAATIDLFGGT